MCFLLTMSLILESNRKTCTKVNSKSLVRKLVLSVVFLPYLLLIHKDFLKNLSTLIGKQFIIIIKWITLKSS